MNKRWTSGCAHREVTDDSDNLSAQKEGCEDGGGGVSSQHRCKGNVQKAEGAGRTEAGDRV